jgi:hypothetical protein
VPTHDSYNGIPYSQDTVLDALLPCIVHINNIDIQRSEKQSKFRNRTTTADHDILYNMISCLEFSGAAENIHSQCSTILARD